MARVFVAAGHHAEAPGAKCGTFNEYDEAILWVPEIVKRLNSGVAVPDGTLKSKINYINERLTNGDIAVEVHFNSCVVDGCHVGDGCVSLHYPSSVKGKALARSCQLAMRKSFQPDRGIKEGWYRGNPDRGVYFFLAKTRCPAVIIEPQFVHHCDEIRQKREQCCADLAEVLNAFVAGD